MTITPTMRNEVFLMCNGTCARCHSELVPFAGEPNSLDVDHIVPRSYGGPDELWNLQPLCATCNRAKGDSEAHDYRPRLIQQRYPKPEMPPPAGQPLRPPIASGRGGHVDGFGWRLQWRYGWMGDRAWVPFVFWILCYWLAVVWAMSAGIFKLITSRSDGGQQPSSATSISIAIAVGVLVGISMISSAASRNTDEPGGMSPPSTPLMT